MHYQKKSSPGEIEPPKECTYLLCFTIAVFALGGATRSVVGVAPVVMVVRDRNLQYERAVFLGSDGTTFFLCVVELIILVVGGGSGGVCKEEKYGIEI